MSVEHFFGTFYLLCVSGCHETCWIWRAVGCKSILSFQPLLLPSHYIHYRYFCSLVHICHVYPEGAVSIETVTHCVNYIPSSENLGLFEIWLTIKIILVDQQIGSVGKGVFLPRLDSLKNSVPRIHITEGKNQLWPPRAHCDVHVCAHRYTHK